MDITYEEYEEEEIEKEGLSIGHSNPIVIKGKTFLKNAMFSEALRAVVKGKLNVNKAAQIYGVPRSTLQRRVAACRSEHKRAISTEYRSKVQKNILERIERNEWNEAPVKSLEEVDANALVELTPRIKDNPHPRECNLLGVGRECIVEDELDVSGDLPSTSNIDYGINRREKNDMNKGRDRIKEEEEEEELNEDIPSMPYIVGEEIDDREIEDEEVIVDEIDIKRDEEEEIEINEEDEEMNDDMPQLDVQYQLYE